MSYRVHRAEILCRHLYGLYENPGEFQSSEGLFRVVMLTEPSVVARYDYGPFGELLQTTGPMVRANPFPCSTKFQDGQPVVN